MVGLSILRYNKHLWSNEMLSANVEDRLKITIDFAQLELSGLRRGDWLNLRDDFRRFFEEKGEHGWWCSLFDIDGTYVLPDTGQSLDDYSEDGFRDLQVEVRAILGNFVDSRRKQVERRPIDIAGLNALATIEVTKTGARILGTPITVCYSLGGNKLIIRAQLRDAILFLLFQLLRAKEASRIVPFGIR